MSKAVSATFVAGLMALIHYWHGCTTELDDEQIALLDEDYPNLLRLVKYGIVLPATQVATVELILQAFPLIERCGYEGEWLPILEGVAAQMADYPHLQFGLLNRLGQVQRLTRQLEAAVLSHQRALVLAERLAETLYMGRVHFQLSADYRLCGDYVAAKAHGLKARGLFGAGAGKASELAAVLNTLGLIALTQGDLKTAVSHLSQAIVHWRTTNEATEFARTLNSLAMVLQQQKRFEQALSTYEEAIALTQETASKPLQIQLQLNVAALYFDWGKLTAAERAFRVAEQMVDSYHGTLFYKAMVMQGIGNVLLHQGQLRTAELYLQQSLQLWRSMEDKLMLANTLGALAEVMSAHSAFERAQSFYEEAMALLLLYPESSWAKKLLQEFTESLAEVTIRA